MKRQRTQQSDSLKLNSNQEETSNSATIEPDDHSNQKDSSRGTRQAPSDQTKAPESTHKNSNDGEGDDSKYFVEVVGRLENQHNQTSAFCVLPEKMHLKIFEFLSIPDIITMATTCKSLAQFISGNYVLKMVQPRPLSSKNHKRVNGRRLLSLSIDFDVTYGKDRWKDAYLERIELLTDKELQQLQRLTVDAYETCFGLEFPFMKLPPLYFEIASHYLSYARQLTHLHISLDKSKKSFEVIDTIAGTLPNLTKVVLKAAFFPKADEIDSEESEIVPENGPNPYTLNSLLRRVLESASIKSLEITGLTGTSLSLYPLKIISCRLEYLKIEHTKFGYIKYLTCPELREFKHVEQCRNFDNPESNCLVHHHPFEDDMNYATLLTEGCPKLDMINGIDLKGMRSCMVDPTSAREWNSLFEDMCDCEENPTRRNQFPSIPFFV